MKDLGICIVCLFSFYLSFSQDNKPNLNNVTGTYQNIGKVHNCITKIKLNGRFKSNCYYFENKKQDSAKKGSWTLHSDTIIFNYDPHKSKRIDINKWLYRDTCIILINTETGKEIFYKKNTNLHSADKK